MTSLSLGLCLVALATAPQPAAEDEPWFELRASAGVAVPTGSAATRRGLGPSGVLSVGNVPRPIALRLELSWDLLSGPPVDPSQAWNSATGNISILGLIASVALRPWSTTAAPYLSLGLGGYQLQRIGGTPSPYGLTYGAHAALGLDLDLDLPVRPFLEVRGLLHLTDYGAQEWNPTVYGTLRLGITHEW